MATLPEPYELMDLQDREQVLFRVTRYEEGEVPIKTTDEPGGKIVHGCRVRVPREDKPIGVPYYDITSKTLCAQIEPMLRDPVQVKRWFLVRAHGVRPRKRYRLEVGNTKGELLKL